MKNKYSQSMQDIFALNFAESKTYIEIGAHKPTKNSNTYLLEVDHGFRGFGIEKNEKYKKLWSETPERKNRIYWADAISFNYKEACMENNLDMTVGFLSCDIEPPENTFLALQTVINQGIRFDCITFEHDKYQSAVDYDPIVRRYLLEKGYKVAVEGVYAPAKERVDGVKKKVLSKRKLFETWFVRNDIECPVMDFDEFKSIYAI